MKTILAALTMFTAAKVFAVEAPLYFVSYTLSEKGKVIRSASVSVEEGKSARIANVARSKDPATHVAHADTLSATVAAGEAAGQISLDYAFKTADGGKSIELAKTGVPVELGMPEVNAFKDSQGNDFELTILVARKSVDP